VDLHLHFPVGLHGVHRDNFTPLHLLNCLEYFQTYIKGVLDFKCVFFCTTYNKAETYSLQ